jgi:hypothetical protein
VHVRGGRGKRGVLIWRDSLVPLLANCGAAACLHCSQTSRQHEQYRDFSLGRAKRIYPRRTRKTRSLNLARFAGPATRELRRGGLPALLANFTAARTISWLLLRSGKANLSAEDAETRSLHLARVAGPVSASEIHPRRTQKPPSLHLDMTSLGAGCLPPQSAALSLANATPATIASALSHVGEGCSMSAANGDADHRNPTVFSARGTPSAADVCPQTPRPLRTNLSWRLVSWGKRSRIRGGCETLPMVPITFKSARFYRDLTECTRNLKPQASMIDFGGTSAEAVFEPRRRCRRIEMKRRVS